MKEIVVSSRKLGVHKILVDDADYELLSQFKWSICKKDKTIYAVRRKSNYSNGNILMHRSILGVTDPKILVDHKDHNGLNNQRDNIRQATHSQNGANLLKKNKAHSKYLGVTWHKGNKKWMAQIMKNRKRIGLGYFEDQERAAIAYNNAAVNIHGEFANLNIIPCGN
jgi:hypothetical protein